MKFMRKLKKVLLKLKLFDEAVEKDLKGNGFGNTVSLKEKVYKQLLQKSNGFTGDLFTK